MNVGKLIYGIIGLFITLILLSGGLSGNLVLRGTNSSSALVVVALIFLVGDLVYIYLALREGEDKPEATVNNIAEPVPSIESEKTFNESQIGAGKTSMYINENSKTIDENFKE